VPHPIHDTNDFSDLGHMATACKAQGYSGGLRLLQVHKFGFALSGSMKQLIQQCIGNSSLAHHLNRNPAVQGNARHPC
jgi:hypothetical protein